MPLHLNPTSTRLVCIMREMPEKTPGGLLIPREVREEHRGSEADVIATGPEVKLIKPGDHIIFNEFTGAEVELEGQWYKIMREEDVLAVIREN